MTKTPEVDPFLDDSFAPLDTRESEPAFVQSLVDIANEDPEAAGLEPELTPASIPVVAPAFAQPEVIDAGEGMTITIEENEEGWKATLDANTGARPEVFKAKFKDDVFRQALIKGVHGTRKINQLHKQIKLAQPAVPVQPTIVPTAPASTGRVLTADEQFAFNAEAKVNLAAAIEK